MLFKDYIEESEREEILKELETFDRSWAEKLKRLLEKKAVLTREGNQYGEIYTERQWDLALTPIFNKERIRVEIMKFLKERGRPSSVKEISEATGIPGKVVLFNLVELRKRKVVDMVKIDGTTPLYALVEG